MTLILMRRLPPPPTLGAFTSDIQANFDIAAQAVGTWIPTIGGSGGQSGQTYSLQIGTWLRQGRLVRCRFDVALTALGIITGNVEILGLPAITTPTVVTGFMLEYWLNMTTAVTCIPARLNTANAILLDKVVAATVNTTAAQLAQADLSATTRLAGTFTVHIA